jgi:V/A-type H+/Na+-transporting ATPase subunit I
MIVPMLKYSFLVYHADYKAFLNDLKRLGALHIETKKHDPTPEIQELYRSVTDLLRTIRTLKERVKGKSETDLKPSYVSGEEVLKRVREIEGALEQKQQMAGSLDKEVQQLMPWGDFSPSRIRELENEGLRFRFLVCRDKYYDAGWEAEYYIKVIGDQGGFRYFVMIERGEQGAKEMIDLPGVDEIQLPPKSISEIHEAQSGLQTEMDELRLELDAIGLKCTGLLSEYCDRIQAELDECNAYHQTGHEVDNNVMVIEGFVPKPKTAELNNYLDAKNILYVAKRPAEDEKVPVQLKNNRFARLFEPIGNLYELPNHKELDLVPFFAPFYMMFFGFALGDAGYGFLIFFGALWLKRKKPEMKCILTLAQWLAVSTVIFGALTGTFFGMDLLESEVAWLEGAKQYMINKDNMFNLALILGVIQILFGMVLKVVNISISKGFAYSYSTIGWLLLIIGGGGSYLLNKADLLPELFGKYLQNGSLIASGILILFLNNPRRNVFMNFLAGLWDVYGMTTGLIGDLLSYIRLFALGVSSAILGFVFNELAMSLKPDIIILGPIVMILILVIGHGMTLFMAGLGAFVHPIRLTFVEFYKNAGFSGGGKRYTPFAEKSLEQ